MINEIKGLVLNFKDPGINQNLPLRPVNSLVDNLTLILSSGRKIEFKDILKNGSLVLVFIRGTWCPFCRMHLSRLRTWVEKLKHKNATVIIVSTEKPEAIQKWLQENQMTYLFASDESLNLSKYFGVHIDPNDFSNAATFLIDQNMMIKVAYKGRRTNTNFNVVEQDLK